jgi:hypothetical protein
MIKIYIVNFIVRITNKILKMRKEKICIYIFKIFGMNKIKINYFNKINFKTIYYNSIIINKKIIINLN